MVELEAELAGVELDRALHVLHLVAHAPQSLDNRWIHGNSLQQLYARFPIGLTEIRNPVAARSALRLRSSGLPEPESIL